MELVAEVRRLIEEARERAGRAARVRDVLDEIAAALLEREMLSAEELEVIARRSPAPVEAEVTRDHYGLAATIASRWITTPGSNCVPVWRRSSARASS